MPEIRQENQMTKNVTKLIFKIWEQIKLEAEFVGERWLVRQIRFAISVNENLNATHRERHWIMLLSGILIVVGTFGWSNSPSWSLDCGVHSVDTLACRVVPSTAVHRSSRNPCYDLKATRRCLLNLESLLSSNWFIGTSFEVPLEIRFAFQVPADDLLVVAVKC